MISAVLYDLDGVIVDSRTVVTNALRDVAAAVLGTAPPYERVRDLAYLPPVDVLQLLGVPEPARVFDARFDAAYAAHAHHARLVPGITEVMTLLKASGLRQAIVTLQRRRRIAMLDLGDILSLVDTIVCFEDAPPKPAPDPLWLALHRLDTRPAHAIFVGDTASDLQAGDAAGVRTGGATWGYRDAAALRHAGADLLLAAPADIAATALTGGPVTVRYDANANSGAATRT
jgi:HAD superfamily hydrolase (TIGR01509 family)